MKNPDTYDVIIVGAGILGTAIGKTIQTSNKDLSIVIIDKFAAAGQGNTAKSNSCYRNIFTTESNIKLADSSISYYKYLQEKKKIDLNLQEFGYLWLLSEEQYNSWNIDSIKYNGNNLSVLQFLELNQVKYEIYTQKELTKFFPELNTSGAKSEDLLPRVEIKYGLLGTQCGSLSPNLLVNAYETMFKEAGGITLYNTEVSEILLKEKGQPYAPDFEPTVWNQSEVAGVKIRKNGEESKILADHVILATGAWVQQLLDPLGIDSLVRPKKRQLFRLCDVKELVESEQFPTQEPTIPFLIFPLGGVFLNPVLGAGCAVVGCADDIGRRFETRQSSSSNRPTADNPYLDQPQGEKDFYIYNVLPILNAYLPDTIDEFKSVHTPSAGMYAYSPDKHPIISRVKELSNLIICSGASGSGIMKADAIARITKALYNEQDQAILFDGSEIQVDKYDIQSRELAQEKAIL